jgi:hypothetical protein
LYSKHHSKILTGCVTHAPIEKEDEQKPETGTLLYKFRWWLMRPRLLYRLQLTGHIADPGWRLLLFKDDAKTVHAVFFQGFPDKDHQFHCQEAKRMAMNYGIESGVKIKMETFSNEPFPFRPADFPCAQLGFSAKHHRWDFEKSILFYAGPLAIFCATPQVDREIRSKYVLQARDADQRGAQ